MSDNVVKLADTVAFVVTMIGAGYVFLKFANKIAPRRA